MYLVLKLIYPYTDRAVSEHRRCFHLKLLETYVLFGYIVPIGSVRLPLRIRDSKRPLRRGAFFLVGALFYLHSILGRIGSSRSIVSNVKKRLPSTDLVVGAKAWGVSEDLPVADACIRVDGPKAHRLRLAWRSLILSHPEDHRRAGVWGGVHGRPAALHAHD